MQGGDNMETCRIYLSGGMSGLTFEEQLKWRTNVMSAIRYGDYNYEKKPIFFNPVDYYNYEETRHTTERELMEFELYNLRKSDLVIVNFNAPNSIGTAMELIIAKEYRIPVIAFGIGDKQVHPWLLETCTSFCGSMREAVEHTVDYYLN